MGCWSLLPLHFCQYASVGKCSGAILVTTKDAGFAVTLLQSLAGSTFDSSQLVLTACMGYQAVKETKLQELKRKTLACAMEENSKGLGVLNVSLCLLLLLPHL